MEPKDIDGLLDEFNQYITITDIVYSPPPHHTSPKFISPIEYTLPHQPRNAWDIQYRWTEDRIEGLQKLIEWYGGMPPQHEFQMKSMGVPVPAKNITRWLREQIGVSGYTDQTREILNELIEMRRSWIDGNYKLIQMSKEWIYGN